MCSAGKDEWSERARDGVESMHESVSGVAMSVKYVSSVGSVGCACAVCAVCLSWCVGDSCSWLELGAVRNVSCCDMLDDAGASDACECSALV